MTGGGDPLPFPLRGVADVAQPQRRELMLEAMLAVPREAVSYALRRLVELTAVCE